MLTIQTIKIGSMYMTCHCLSTDNKYLACGTYREIKIIDCITGKQAGYDLVGHKATIWSLQFSPDSKLLVSGSEDKTVRVWDVNKSKQIGESLVGHTKAVTAVSFAQNGLFVASASNDNSIIIWNIQNRRELKRIFLRENWIFIKTLEYSNRFRFIIFFTEQTTSIYKTETGQRFTLFFFNDNLNMNPDKVCSQKVTLNKKIFASYTAKIVRIWDQSSKKQINRFSANFDYIQKFQFALEIDNDIKFDLENLANNRLKHNPVQKQYSQERRIMEYGIQISPDNRYIVFGSKINIQRVQY